MCTVSVSSPDTSYYENWPEPNPISRAGAKSNFESMFQQERNLTMATIISNAIRYANTEDRKCS